MAIWQAWSTRRGDVVKLALPLFCRGRQLVEGFGLLDGYAQGGGHVQESVGEIAVITRKAWVVARQSSLLALMPTTCCF